MAFQVGVKKAERDFGSSKTYIYIRRRRNVRDEKGALNLRPFFCKEELLDGVLFLKI
jgi:hypothetical protein